MELDPRYPLELLERFARYVDYDPGRTRFTLFSRTYNMTRAVERVPEINEYDPSGKLACIYVKRAFREELERTEVPLFQAVSDPASFEGDAEMWAAFCSEEMGLIERELAQLAASLVNAAAPVPLIGDAGALVDGLASAVDAAVDGLSKCSEHVWLASGRPMSRPGALPDAVEVFDSMADCLAGLSAGPDRLVLAYVRQEVSADGFFGIFLKSRGSIVSYDDLILEKFPGQHANMRNGRYLEAHAYGLFPYAQSVRMAKPDYLGYPAEHEVDGDRIDVLSLGEDAYMPLMLAMSCVANRLDGRAFDPGSEANMMVSSLAPGSARAQALALRGAGAIVAANDTSGLVDFDEADVVSGRRLGRRAGRRGGEAAPSVGDLVREHGAGARIDLAAAGAPPAPEFVQSVSGMRELAYLNARRQLAAAVLEGVVRDVRGIGGPQGAMSWFLGAVREREEAVRLMCARRYAADPGPDDDFFLSYKLSGEPGTRSLYVGKAPFLADPALTPLDEMRDDPSWRAPRLFDREGTREPVVFAFKPTSAADIAALLGLEARELPAAVRSWSYDGRMSPGYNGNPLLEAVDPVGELRHPLAGFGEDLASNGRRSRGDGCDFVFQVGFTKRALNKLVRGLALTGA